MNDCDLFSLRKSCLKMKSCTEFILILLGLFIKASSAENSTQVYYIEVHIEAGAYKNFTDFIDNLILDVNSSATVQNFSITTECNSLITGNVNCSCNSGYSWSEEVCQNFSQCCNQNECMFNDPNPRAMCLSNNKVLVNGSFTLADVPYTSSLAESGSQDYNAFVEKYTGKLQQVYSTLGWFDSLKITRLRQGSIIADFVMTVTAPFTSAELENTTKQLQKNNNASFNLIVTVSLENGQTAYQAFEGIFCDEKLEGHDVSCQFQNRLNQTKLFSLYVPIINDDSTICKSELDWPDAKANFNATKLCNPTAVGLQMRYCMANGTWGDLISFCVNQAISKLLNVAMNLQRGLGIVEKQANGIFVRLKLSTDDKSFETFANVNASVGVLESMRDASNIQNSKWNDTAFPDILKSLSNLLNGSLNDSWRPVGNEGNYTLALKYLRAVDGIINQTKFATATNQFQQENVQVKIYNKSDPSTQKTFSSEFGVSVSITETVSNVSVQTAFKNLGSKLPNTLDGKETVPSEIILLVKADKKTKISAEYNQQRLPNHEMYCVYLNEDNSTWSEGGCKWGGVSKPKLCTCDHLSAFTILMAKHPIELKYMEELTYTGLGFSIVSLTLCLVIEFLVWNAVVKTNIAHFRHTVLVNITVCLLIAHCSFLAAPVPSASPPYWCLPLTVMKHFCFLAAFFWMLCLSLGLLHQVIFVFVHLRKKVYLGLCLFLGYICPLVIVIVTFITYDNGRPGSYYSGETCWLIYEAALKGSIHAFLFPVFIIVFVNMFTMVVVISRILKPNLSEGSSHDEKEVARSIVKTIVLLTPTLGITWILGLFVLMLDLTTTPYAQIVNYAFTFFNSFQGFFILLTGCFGEKKVRDALQKRFGRQQSMNYKSESSSRITSATKTK
ncbi:adhesion G-protein coupled receptor F3-like isoform X3 [Pygocentrus nattereri]|uniref:adhesion G-protein coupled receptor F3-like isoform X3 n=1 Tax=Pygocentrus nattereri TaxID=42514 RepID=UPI0008142948|nr:adhesion G-protein coupled receptor F3-like isoform X3 [Pygocentrus nattereri]